MTLLTPIDRPEVKQTEEASTLSAEALLEFGRRHGAEAAILTPGVEPLKELPWHAHAVNYIAMGMSSVDTAKACDSNSYEIGKLLRSPRFQERVANKMAENGNGDLLKLFQAASLSAYATLVEINENPMAPAMARLKAATEILDRHLGKATQFMEIKSQNTNLNPVERVAALENEVGNLQKELKVLPSPASEASCAGANSSTSCIG